MLELLKLKLSELEKLSSGISDWCDKVAVEYEIEALKRQIERITGKEMD